MFFKLTDSKHRFHIKSNERLNIVIGEHHLETVIKSNDTFGIFGSNNPHKVSSILSHEWFEAFAGQVINKNNSDNTNIYCINSHRFIQHIIGIVS